MDVPSQLFSDPGKKGNPLGGRLFLVGQPPNKNEKIIGATENLSTRGATSSIILESP